MSGKNEIQEITNRVDKCKHKLAAAKAREDRPVVRQFEEEIRKHTKKIAQLKHKQSFDLNTERKSLLAMPFKREITKSEQADMGKLKKSVKGLIVVHPMTKIGKELGLKVMTGYAPKSF
ncbi:hypothetical protein BCU68_03655 [Vibrio sp. 10N.286.49.B3]|uniref:YibL family ribosome-associated protein n=1 Tax=Vibrio sp. 10N.286.49.B3 TaxID=1880855 RepID=UPI000C850158|nr:YibL family ribosome-associated protein [Vibrio sp. 10N.286.49.B3]PMH43096.1 hypothetical protein BCU68_03655 [Vibrio sp. 10N.286.49.B3]